MTRINRLCKTAHEDSSQWLWFRDRKQTQTVRGRTGAAAPAEQGDPALLWMMMETSPAQPPLLTSLVNESGCSVQGPLSCVFTCVKSSELKHFSYPRSRAETAARRVLAGWWDQRTAQRVKVVPLRTSACFCSAHLIELYNRLNRKIEKSLDVQHPALSTWTQVQRSPRCQL